MALTTFAIDRLIVTPSEHYKVSINYGRNNFRIPVPGRKDLTAADPNNVFAFSMEQSRNVPRSDNSIFDFRMYGSLTGAASAWADTAGILAEFEVRASLNGVPILKSQPFKTRKTRGKHWFLASVFELIPQLGYGQPFFYSGDWTWTVVPVTPNLPVLPVAAIVSQNTWRMEIFFLPNYPLDPWRAHVPADFLRLVALPGAQLLQRGPGLVAAQALQPGQVFNPLVAYAKRTIEWIWNHGAMGTPNNKVISYDRQSQFNMTTTGHKAAPAYADTGFWLKEWMRPLIHRTTNCYDLSGITQLTLRLYGSASAAAGAPPIIPVQWIYATAMGFSNPCHLFGVGARPNPPLPVTITTLQKIDAPYLFGMSSDIHGADLDDRTVGAYANQPAAQAIIDGIADPILKERQKQTLVRDVESFENHAYIEVQLSGPASTYTVMDATAAKAPAGLAGPNPVGFFEGQHTRGEYINNADPLALDNNVVTMWDPNKCASYAAARAASLALQPTPPAVTNPVHPGCTIFFPLT